METPKGKTGSTPSGKKALDSSAVLALIAHVMVRRARQGTCTHHERFEIRPPPLRKAITNLPFRAVRHVRWQPRGRGRREAVVKPFFQAADLVFSGKQVVSRADGHREGGVICTSRSEMKMHIQLEKGVGNLQHEDVGVAVVVDYKDALDRPAHAKVLIVVLEALETRRNRGIFFRLSFFRTLDGQLA